MSIVPTSRNDTHPAWCTRKHRADWQVHDVQIGVDLELSHELAYAVNLQQVEDSPTEINLVRHTPDETTLTRLTPLEAGILRDLLTEALEVLARR